MNEMMQRFATENEQLKLNMNEIKTALGDVKTAVSESAAAVTNAAFCVQKRVILPAAELLAKVLEEDLRQ